MRPKHRVFCPQSNRLKILFETEKKAVTFMRFNADEIAENAGHAPIRAYYCTACAGWHVTSHRKY